MADITPDINERLASWRHVGDVVEQHPASTGETGRNEREVRVRQRRTGNMCLHIVKTHDGFYADLEAFVRQEGRSAQHQQRVEDMAAFALGVFEQSSALFLEKGIQQELENLPREVIQTVYVEPPPPPPKSWFQRLLGG
jgi:hypothetical protein